MIIRALRETDIDVLLTMAENLARESPVYSQMTFAPEKVYNFLQAALDNSDPHATTFVIEDDTEDTIAGFLCAYITEELFFLEDVAWDATFYISPEYRGRVGIKTIKELMSHYKQWAANSGAAAACLGISTDLNPEKTARLYEACGFIRNGITLRAT